MGLRDGDALGHVPHFGYTPMVMRALGDHSSLRMSCIREARQLDPDCQEKAQGLIHLPAGFYLQPFPAQHLPLHHLGGFSDERFPHSVQVGYVRVVFSISLAVLELYRTTGPVLWLLGCRSLGLDHQGVMAEGSTSRCVTQTSDKDGWILLFSLGDPAELLQSTHPLSGVSSSAFPSHSR